MSLRGPPVTDRARCWSRLVVPAVWLLLGCGGIDGSEALADQHFGVLHGQSSPSEQNAVLLIEHKEGWSGTGSLVAPRLVLTAKQLVFDVRLHAGNLVCTPGTMQPIEGVVDPGDLFVRFGEKHPFELGANVVRIHAGGDLDLCGDDIVLLELDQSFPVAPLAMRLDEPPGLGERGLLIGWGMSDDIAANPSQTIARTRQQADVEIHALGGVNAAFGAAGMFRVPDGSFVASEGGCYGDAGAPFISLDTGAIVGTLSTFEPEELTTTTDSARDCYGGYSTFRALSAQREWLIEAFSEANSAPWIEGFAEPGESGRSCEADEECLSGRCLKARTGQFCSERCESGGCAPGQLCAAMNGEHWCLPERIGEADGASACSAARGSRSRAAVEPLPILALLAALRRLRSSNRTRVGPPHEDPT